MNFKLFALFAFVLPLAIACQQNTDNNQAAETQVEQEKPAPQQNPQTPNARQPAMEVKEVSDEEFQRFMATFQNVQAFRQRVQQEMIAAVQEQGLEAQRYGEIQQAQGNPAAGSDISPEEMQKFQTAAEEVQKIQSQAQQQMQETFSEAGLTERRYQEISMMMQSDPNLQQKFQSSQQAQQ